MTTLWVIIWRCFLKGPYFLQCKWSKKRINDVKDWFSDYTWKRIVNQILTHTHFCLSIYLCLLSINLYKVFSIFQSILSNFNFFYFYIYIDLYLKMYPSFFILHSYYLFISLFISLDFVFACREFTTVILQ